MRSKKCLIKKSSEFKMKDQKYAHFTSKAEGFITLVSSAFAFSLMTVCIKQLGGRIPVTELVFFRSIFSLSITRVMMIREKIYPWGLNKKLLLIRGLIGTGALLCVFKAIESLPLAAATIIQYTYPIFTAFFAWLLLREHTNKRIFIAIILGWIGIQIVVQPLWMNATNNQLTIISIITALTGALLTALAYITVRKLSETENKLVIVFYFPLVSIPITIPFLIEQFIFPTSVEWLYILGIGVFTQLGQLLITKGLSLMPAAYAGAINYTQVLFATIWGVLIFSEALNIYILVGAAFVLSATLITLSGLKDFQQT